MARIEEDKEDLIRDATALVERAEIQCEGLNQLVTLGFFADGRCSVYFDQDPFYQFDTQGRLRRAYEAGFLYRSQQSTLSRIDRRRDANADGKIERVVLQRADLTSTELQVFVHRMKKQIQSLYERLEAGEYQVLRAVTPDSGIPSATISLLHLALNRDADAIAPPASPR